MKRIEFDQDDNKWLEDRMLQESQEIKIPESLEPENMLVKLTSKPGMEKVHGNSSVLCTCCRSILVYRKDFRKEQSKAS